MSQRVQITSLGGQIIGQGPEANAVQRKRAMSDVGEFHGTLQHRMTIAGTSRFSEVQSSIREIRLWFKVHGSGQSHAIRKR